VHVVKQLNVVFIKEHIRVVARVIVDYEPTSIPKSLPKMTASNFCARPKLVKQVSPRGTLFGMTVVPPGNRVDVTGFFFVLFYHFLWFSFFFII